MSRGEHGSHGVRAQILKDRFQRVSLQQACALVGILFEDDFIISVEIKNPTAGKSRRETVRLQAVDPQAASILVADVFGLDCDALFLQFQQEWARLKGSMFAKKIRARIESHSSVERLVRQSSMT